MDTPFQRSACASTANFAVLLFCLREKVRVMEVNSRRGPEKFVRVIESSSYGSSSYGGLTVLYFKVSL